MEKLNYKYDSKNKIYFNCEKKKLFYLLNNYIFSSICSCHF